MSRRAGAFKHSFGEKKSASWTGMHCYRGVVVLRPRRPHLRKDLQKWEVPRRSSVLQQHSDLQIQAFEFIGRELRLLQRHSQGSMLCPQRATRRVRRLWWLPRRAEKARCDLSRAPPSRCTRRSQTFFGWDVIRIVRARAGAHQGAGATARCASTEVRKEAYCRRRRDWSVPEARLAGQSKVHVRLGQGAGQ